MARKQSRFRFTTIENLRTIDETYNILCEDVSTTEIEMWENLHGVLSCNNSRFESCSVRLLKGHMLDQVTKYKKIESGEIKETGKERENTPWKEKMEKLLTVWLNYNNLVELETTQKNQKTGRPRKTAEKSDLELAKEIRNAALSSMRKQKAVDDDHSSENSNSGDPNLKTTDVSPTSQVDENLATPSTSQVNENLATPSTSQVNENLATSSTSQVNENLTTPSTSKDTSQTLGPSTKRRKCTTKVEGVWSYLAEKSRDELQLNREIHKDDLNFKKEHLEFKKQKLEFEREKWQAERDEREKRDESQAATTKLLSVMLISEFTEL
uniref:Uncharacterized protein n=1 Tax=Strigamia maritima TaxID=126957 RepID=T1IH47_STRMM